MNQAAANVQVLKPRSGAPSLIPLPARRLRRTLDPSFLNRVVNDASVRPWVTLGGAGALDVSPLVASPANIALVGDHGGFILERHEPGVYELHTQFLPAGRGPAVYEAAAEGLRHMMAATDCSEIVTRVPACNRAAEAGARRGGFRPIFTRDNAWTGPDGSPCAVTYYRLDVDDWREQDPTLPAVGEWFHQQLDAAMDAGKVARPPHPEDPAHDRAAGASVLMLKAGNAAKGVYTYNKWARLAGYSPIRLLSLNPVVVDLSDGGITVVVEVRNGEMEFLLCR
jgi:hypothetical protein